LIFVACAFLAAACSSGDPAGTEPRPCPSPPVAANSSAVPREFPLEDFGTITKVAKRQDGFVNVTVISDDSIIEAFPPIARSLLEHDFETLSADNEGFEAEIYFRRGKSTAGAYVMREGPCEGQITIRLTYGKQRFPR
jgi:hypothetical protein